MTFNGMGQFEQRFKTADDAGKIILGILLVCLLCFAIKTELQDSLIQRFIWRFFLRYAVLRCMPYMTGGLLILWVSGVGGSIRLERSKRDTHPTPKIADWLLCIFLSKEQRDYIIGDTEEAFPKWVERYGVKKARSRYYREVFSVVKPGLIRFLLGIVAATWAIEVIHRCFHL